MMTTLVPDTILDAKASGCTELIMLIFQTMKTLEPGETIEVLASDEAADLDIAAWCHMTGHTILACDTRSNPKRILIRKRE